MVNSNIFLNFALHLGDKPTQRSKTETTMNKQDILNAITELSYSQGFYGRILRQLNEMDKDQREEVLNELEKQNFRDPVDMVLFFEQ